MMKKTLLALFVIPTMLFLNSCGYEDCSCPPAAYPPISYYVTVYPNDWVSNGSASDWRVSLYFPEINNYVTNNGAVLVYEEIGNNLFTQLPYSAYTYDIWPEFYSGGLDIMISYKDNGTARPETRTFKVVILQ